MRLIEARFEEGLLKPAESLALRPGERVGLIVVRRPDPSRWELQRFATTGQGEDLALAEQGLSDWADVMETEDRRRLELLDAADRYVADLVAEVGPPAAAQCTRAGAVARRLVRRPAPQAG